jgi:hypothetical protein
VELLYRNGYGILVARSKTTKVQIGKGAFAKDFLTCSLWETQGVFFLQQRAYGGAVRRRWYADARREMVAHYVHIRPQSVVQPPVKVIDFRVTQDWVPADVELNYYRDADRALAGMLPLPL